MFERPHIDKKFKPVGDLRDLTDPEMTMRHEISYQYDKATLTDLRSGYGQCVGEHYEFGTDAYNENELRKKILLEMIEKEEKNRAVPVPKSGFK